MITARSDARTTAEDNRTTFKRCPQECRGHRGQHGKSDVLTHRGHRGQIIYLSSEDNSAANIYYIYVNVLMLWCLCMYRDKGALNTPFVPLYIDIPQTHNQARGRKRQEEDGKCNRIFYPVKGTAYDHSART